MTKQTGKEVTQQPINNYTVEQRMSKVFILDPGGAGRASVLAQSPDAVDRNLALTIGADVESHGVQSPDAIDRNLAFEAPAGDSAGRGGLLGGEYPDATASDGVATDEGQLTDGTQMHMAPITGEGDLSQ